jgi:hypothetical protein
MPSVAGSRESWPSAASLTGSPLPSSELVTADQLGVRLIQVAHLEQRMRLAPWLR